MQRSRSSDTAFYVVATSNGTEVGATRARMYTAMLVTVQLGTSTRAKAANASHVRKLDNQMPACVNQYFQSTVKKNMQVYRTSECKHRTKRCRKRRGNLLSRKNSIGRRRSIKSLQSLLPAKWVELNFTLKRVGNFGCGIQRRQETSTAFHPTQTKISLLAASEGIRAEGNGNKHNKNWRSMWGEKSTKPGEIQALAGRRCMSFLHGKMLLVWCGIAGKSRKIRRDDLCLLRQLAGGAPCIPTTVKQILPHSSPSFFAMLSFLAVVTPAAKRRPSRTPESFICNLERNYRGRERQRVGNCGPH